MLLPRMIILSTLLFAPAISIAAALPWGDKPYSHFSDQEPITDMLKALAASERTPIVISPKVKGAISAHYKEKTAKSIFEEVTSNHGLIWYFDRESLYVYTEDEVKSGSVSLKTISPQELTSALKRLDILDSKFKWEISEVDNVISFNGPERFIDVVIENARLIDNQRNASKRVYKWIGKDGRVNYSTEKPTGVVDGDWDVRVKEKYPGFVVLDVVKD